jgi:hypothetical protein
LDVQQRDPGVGAVGDRPHGRVEHVGGHVAALHQVLEPLRGGGGDQREVLDLLLLELRLQLRHDDEVDGGEGRGGDREEQQRELVAQAHRSR